MSSGKKRQWYNAEVEYRRVVALDPKNRTANISPAIAVFSKLKTGEAVEIDRSLLTVGPNDPGVNLPAGEMRVQRNLYAKAEPYLSECENLKPESVSPLHALMARAYAAMDRIPSAIAEYRAGLSTDDDGSIHFQLGRVYQ